MGKYKKLMITSSDKLINEIRDLLNSNQFPNPLLLHRLFHNLKGQVLFMNLTDIGQECFEGEKILGGIVKRKTSIDDSLKKSLIKLLENIDLRLKKL